MTHDPAIRSRPDDSTHTLAPDMAPFTREVRDA